MVELRALIAAAGRGSRAGLPYPKTLYPVQGVPILLRLAAVLTPFDTSPTVIVNPAGEQPIRECLLGVGIQARIVVQPEPLGMGDAVLCFVQSSAFDLADHLLLVWGDIPFIQTETVAAVVQAHFEHDNDFTFATRVVDSAYTVVSRDSDGRVKGVFETREQGIAQPQAGERDVGLFVFRKDVTLAALREELPGKFGRATGEHGFLYVIGHLAERGLRVEALPVATELDLVSLNSLSDLATFEGEA